MSGVKERFERMTDRFSEAIENNEPQSQAAYATLVFAVVAEELEHFRAESDSARGAGAPPLNRRGSARETAFQTALQKLTTDAGAVFISFRRKGRYAGELRILVQNDEYALKGESRQRTSSEAIDDGIYVDLQRKIEVVIAAAND